MSATIQVTIPKTQKDYQDSAVEEDEATVIVRIHLRDTLLHMDGSLDALCAGFKVPKPWK